MRLKKSLYVNGRDKDGNPDSIHMLLHVSAPASSGRAFAHAKVYAPPAGINQAMLWRHEQARALMKLRRLVRSLAQNAATKPAPAGCLTADCQSHTLG